MARDYTKYTVEGVGENFNKRQLVFEIVKDYIQKHTPSLEELSKVFPDNAQGSKGFIRKESEVDDAKRFNMKEPLKIKNGMHIVVSNQWGENIPAFIELAEKLGYKIAKSEEKQDSGSLIDLSEFDPFQLNKQFSTYENDDEICAKLNEEIEQLLDQDPKYNSYAIVFQAMQWGYDYYREDTQEYFTIEQDSDDLYTALREQSLISRILEKHQINIEDVNSSNIDFKLLFTSYLCKAINTLAEIDNDVLLAEFIFSQSCSEEDEIELADDGDWLSDLTIDIIHYIYGKNLNSSDYEDGFSFEANHFGSYVDCGYNYPKAAQEIINDII